MASDTTVASAVFFVAVLAAIAVADRLVKRQYDIAREQWKANGCPPGFWWCPTSSLVHGWKRDKACARWIVTTPGWIQADRYARTLQQSLRVVWVVAAGTWLWLTSVWL